MKQELFDSFIINYFDEIDSTNTRLSQDAINKGLSEFTIYLAKKQIAGRGRGNRIWQSFDSNLHFSILLKPNISIDKIHQINFLAIIALGNIIEKLLPAQYNISYKWPNDLLICRYKIAGILLENIQFDSSQIATILGIGVNINKHPLNKQNNNSLKPSSNIIYPANDLAHFGVNIDKVKLLKLFLQEFRIIYHSWQNFGFSKYRNIWLSKAYNIDEEITVTNNKSIIRGIFKGIDQNGQLLLFCNNQIIKLTNGEIDLFC